ncbi:MAG: succinate dehydrogenase, cytochrome b556 subunit [Pseudomonadota bacterium]
MATPQRPLSPHLGIYRWQLTMALSILHRATGVFLSLGAVIFVTVLSAIASGPEYYGIIHGWLSNPIGQIFLIAWTASLFLHMGNGVRHLIWDMGLGLEKTTANQSGLYVIAFAVIATLITWLSAWGIF